MNWMDCKINRLRPAGKTISWYQGFDAGISDLNPFPHGDAKRFSWAEGHTFKMDIINREASRYVSSI